MDTEAWVPSSATSARVVSRVFYHGLAVYKNRNCSAKLLGSMCQRDFIFGGALNLNIHFQMIFLDGDYVNRGVKVDRYRWVKAPSTAELSQLTHRQSTGSWLEPANPRSIQLTPFSGSRQLDIIST